MNQAQAKLKRWREDPISFVREELHAEPDPWQAEVLRAFPHNERLAMKACKGPGKTTILSWMCWNFLATRPHPKIAATSITKDNLDDGLWPEMAKWQNESKFLQQAFIWQKTRIFSKQHPETWWMSARSWAKTADQTQQANTLAGLHADYLLFVLDEAGGIPDAVMAAAEAGLSTIGGEHKIVIAGNPTHLEGPLYRAATTERHMWFIVEITGDPEDPMRAPRISKQWALDQIEKYGRDNPWVMVNVFGQFPPSSINSLLGVDEVTAAMKRHLTEDQFQWAQKRLGIDVARFGDDRTVIFPRQGLASFHPIVMRHARDTAASVEIANKVMFEKNKFGSEIEFFDDTVGWAHGAIDVMRSSGHSPVGVAFNGKATDPRYFNKRAEMWMLMAQWVQHGGALPPIPELVRELTAPTYTFAQGKFQLEAKDQIKLRLGFSPDLGDGLALTFAIPEAPKFENFPGFQPEKKLVHEYDPYDPERL
jgi:hypothetical protein